MPAVFLLAAPSKHLDEVVATGRLVVAIAFAEKGLKGMVIATADDLGVRTQRGQWWLPG
jgi:hypothetical protein